MFRLNIRIIVALLCFTLFSHSIVQARPEVSPQRKELSDALKKKDFATVKSVMESHSIDIEELSERLATPLMDAAHYGDLKSVQYFIEKGADVNFERRSDTPLSEAVSDIRNNDALVNEIILALIGAGADVNKYKVEGWWSNPSPFMKVCSENAVKCVETFLAAGVDLEAKDPKGKTALMFAIENEKTDVVSILLNRGAKLETKDSLGQTALFYALQKKSPLLVHMLIDAGAETQLADYEGTTTFIL